MKVVLDASVLAKAMVNERDSDRALKLLEAHSEGKIELVAPALILYEVGNVLRGHKMGAKTLCTYLTHLLSLGIELLDLHREQEVLVCACELSKTRDITFYDASYLAVAKARNIKLVTADEELKKKAGDAIIPFEALEIP
jgi:predicted nucleic acid-binding protein